MTIHELTTAIWPSIPEFARDVGLKASHVHTMRVRGRIPVEYWPAIIEAAQRRGFDVTAEMLLKMDAASAGKAASEGERETDR